jgi:hypothetical protein
VTPASAPTPSERFDEIAEELAARHPEVQRGMMFGAPTLKRDGKAVCCFWHGTAMVFKLVAAEARERALALPGAGHFDPMGGRPMREWVVVFEEQAAEWPRLAAEALAGMARAAAGSGPGSGTRG